MAQPRTARLGLGFLWGVIGFSLIGIIVIVSRGGAGRVDEYEQQRAENRLKTRLELEEAAQKKLSEYAWVNKEKGVVAIPIDRAMELAVADLQAQKVGASEEKAVIMPTLIVPPVPQESDAAPAEAAPAEEAKGESAPAEAATPEGEAAPAATETPAAPATENAPAAPATEASPAPAEAPAEAVQPAETPAASGEAAPATPEAPSEP